MTSIVVSFLDRELYGLHTPLIDYILVSVLSFPINNKKIGNYKNNVKIVAQQKERKVIDI